MKDFFRSLRYLKPYRGQLAISIICVLVIAVLWGGGLGMLLPVTKVLISPEGLHGWAWNSIVQDKLGVTVVQRLSRENIKIDGQELELVLDIVHIPDDSPAKQADIDPNDLIVGLGKDSPENPDRLVRADILIRKIADTDPDEPLILRLYRPATSDTRIVTVTPAEIGLGSRVLGFVVRKYFPDEPKSFAGRFPMLLWLIVFALVITYLRNLLRFTQEYLVQSAVFRGVMDLRSDNYHVVLRLPITFFSEKGISDTMSRFIQDTGELARGQTTLFGKTLVEPAKAVATLTIAMILSWKLTLIALIAGPPVFLLINKLGKKMKHASKRALESWASILAVLEETLGGIRVVKAYTMEGTERRRFFRANRSLLKQQRKIARIDSAIAPTIESMGLTTALCAGALAGYWVFNHQMRPDAFLAMMACLAALFDPLRKLAKVATRFQRADAAATRIFELQDMEQEKHAVDAPQLAKITQSLEFRNVRFRYPSASFDALKNINLKIQAGRTVAFVGPNGCGKTTLVSMVLRLLEPAEGSVLIDGNDISKYSLRSLRKQIGLVSQDTVLFHATIGENISYGRRRPREEDVLAASKKAFVHEFVENLPDQYDTMVAERGSTLSGGQKQRITIARAILRDPEILIFDEATSQVDGDSERKIHQAMENFVGNRTTLVVAHRFATILSADRIVVMNEGRIVDDGTHAELLKRCELYQHLYKTQFEGAD